MEYTKGEWTTKSCENGGRLLIRDAVQQSIQILPEEDAYLISAAPDMYEACLQGLDLAKKVLYRHPDDAIAKLQYKIIKKALAKAEGKS